ncbi:MAG: hypothetical protein IPM77_06395 [Crocinitomicaceae bacterium]|nr:hypothetical protein [Crocinitomicaceae bacterium]
MRQMDGWDGEQFFFYFLGIALMILFTVIAVMKKEKGMALNRWVIYTPFLVVFLYIVYYLYQEHSFDMEWFSFLVLNFYILGFGISAMILGNKSRNLLYMFYGAFVVVDLLWMRYFDMDIAFWLKGLLFIGVGFLFFLIHYLSVDEFEN